MNKNEYSAMNSLFDDYTEGRDETELNTARDAAFVELDKYLRDVPGGDEIMEKVIVFRYKAERAAFNAGFRTARQLLTE